MYEENGVKSVFSVPLISVPSKKCAKNVIS